MIRWIIVCLVLLCPAYSYAQVTLSSGLVQFMELSFTNNTTQWDVVINDESNAQQYGAEFNSGLGRFVFNHPNAGQGSGAKFFIGGSQHLFTRPGDNFTWNFIGVGPGQLFRATPQNGNPGIQLMMGIASTGLSGLFVNNQFNITMSVAGITNPGQFSYYINDNTPESATGTSATPIFSTQIPLNTFTYAGGTQNFFNMAFSAPGDYDVDFQFSGTRTPSNGGGTFTSPFYRYRFEVALFAVPEPTTWALIGLAVVGGGLAGWRYRSQRRKLLDASVGQAR